ncbi:MAG TPA: hypothetical protein VLN61_07390 [Pseudolabrys sp.]|nr:hypothetical protein [Pseudolabrys sp.]
MFVQPLDCDLEARRRGAIHAAIEQPKLERIEHVEHLAALCNRAFLALGLSMPGKAISASTVKTARSEPAAAELRGASCSLTVKAPPALRHAMAGADTSADPFDSAGHMEAAPRPIQPLIGIFQFEWL